jgi:orotate phosphoribosyltransferase
MKVKIAQKDIIGYFFLLALAAACIVIGIRILSNHHVISGIFGLALGAILIAASTSMVLRKE